MANSVAFQERYDANDAEYRRNKVHGKGGKFASSKDGISNEAATDLHAKATAKDGGFTYDVHTGQHATEGYSVSPYPEKTKVIPAKDLTPGHIQAFAQTHKVALAKPGHKLGAWNDNGTVSLDVVIVAKTHGQGAAIGVAHKQKSMYNLKTHETIQLGGSGGKAYASFPTMASIRALTPSRVDRSVTRGGKACSACVFNTLPMNVPVHPGCRCNINTDNVSVGITAEDMSVLRETFSDAEVKAIGDLTASMILQPETAAVFPLDDFRFGDMAAWLGAVAGTGLSVRSVLSDGDTVVCAAGPETEGSLSTDAAGRAAVQDNRRVVMFRADATPDQLVMAYRIICEG